MSVIYQKATRQPGSVYGNIQKQHRPRTVKRCKRNLIKCESVVLNLIHRMMLTSTCYITVIKHTASDIHSGRLDYDISTIVAVFSEELGGSVSGQHLPVVETAAACVWYMSPSSMVPPAFWPARSPSLSI